MILTSYHKKVVFLRVPYPHLRLASGPSCVLALNFSILDAGILLMVQQIRLMMFS